MTPQASTFPPRTEPPELAALARRFQSWRARRQRGERIPEELWQAATDWARIHGLHPTVAALKLNYYDLQRRLQSGGRPRRSRSRAPRFVELPAVVLPPGGAPGGTVELVHAGGTRLILRWGEARPRDFLSLVRLFLRRGP